MARICPVGRTNLDRSRPLLGNGNLAWTSVRPPALETLIEGLACAAPVHDRFETMAVRIVDMHPDAHQIQSTSLRLQEAHLLDGVAARSWGEQAITHLFKLPKCRVFCRFGGVFRNPLTSDFPGRGGRAVSHRGRPRRPMPAGQVPVEICASRAHFTTLRVPSAPFRAIF